MTIAILFFINEELVFRRNVCATSLYDKILEEFSEEELIRHGVPYYEDDKAIITDQDFIEKVWYACVEHVTFPRTVSQWDSPSMHYILFHNLQLINNS